MALTKEQLETMLEELDEALVQAFPESEPIEVLVVGGACLVFAGVIDRLTTDIDVIVTNFFGQGETSLVYDLDKLRKKVRRIIETIGKNHGLRGSERCFLNDDPAIFLREMGDIPASRLLRAYQKLHLYIPVDLSYILACKLLAARKKDEEDIAALRALLHVQTRSHAQHIVDHHFPDRRLQESLYDLSKNLDQLFGPET